MIETRPDIAFATSIVSRHAKNPEKTHIEAVKIILRYLDVTKNRDIIFDEDDLKIVDYSDFDWAEDKKERKSILDYVFMLNNDSISWCSKRQITVALSSTEAEYMTLTLTAKETTWLRLLMTELEMMTTKNESSKINVLKRESIIALKDDNQSVIALTNNFVLHSRIKHIDIQYHFIRNEILKRRIDLIYVLIENMIANELTKSLTHVKFFTFVRQLNMKISTFNQDWTDAF